MAIGGDFLEETAVCVFSQSDRNPDLDWPLRAEVCWPGCGLLGGPASGPFSPRHLAAGRALLDALISRPTCSRQAGCLFPDCPPVSAHPVSLPRSGSIFRDPSPCASLAAPQPDGGQDRGLSSPRRPLCAGVWGGGSPPLGPVRPIPEMGDVGSLEAFGGGEGA